MFPGELQAQASAVLRKAGAAGIRIVAAETCTAGLLSACMTSVPGASKVFERGFTLYHDSAKATGLGVPEVVSREHGAVSAQVTRALAEGALRHSTAGVSAAITGYAGPGGGNDHDPVGTVYVAVARSGKPAVDERHIIEGDRDAVRLGAVRAALTLLDSQLRSA